MISTPARPRPFSRLALAALLLAAPLAEARGAVPVASFENAEGSALGPGRLVPPQGVGYQDGDFDLRRFAVLVDGPDVLFVVTLGAPIRPPPAPEPAGRPAGPGIFLQNVDIYLDTDPSPGSGTSACLPGRRVAFADGRTWEAAVVLTPRPDLARAAARRALGPAAERVVFPEALTIRGRTITARVPASALGGTPQASWGYSVQLSGALPAPDAGAAPRPPGADAGEQESLTMPVLPAAGPLAFGGAPAGDLHPRVVDLLLPPGADRSAVLASFDTARRTLARLPFVQAIDPSLAAQPSQDPAPEPAVAAAPPGAPAATTGESRAPSPAEAPRPVQLSANLMPRLSTAAPAAGSGSAEGAARAPLVVVDVADDLVTARGVVTGLKAMQFGRVVDAQGITVARVMILRLLEKGLLASAIAGKERIRLGSSVLFDASPAP